MRCFIAVEPPKDLRNRIEEFSKKMFTLPGVKITPKESIHYTLKFLGEIDKTKLDKTIKIVGKNS